MSHLTMKDQTRIFYKDQGTGTPVVLIHGWPVNADMWEYQVPALIDRGFRVVSYDRRGFGRSSQPAAGYNYDVFADDLNEICTQLNLNKPALVGFSMGGGEIARYLSKYGSDRASKAVLISSVVPYMLKTDDNPDGVKEEVFDNIQSGLKEDRPHFLAGFAKDFYGVGMVSHPVSNEILNWTAFMAYQASPKSTLDCVMAFGKTDFRPDLKAFTMPTLIIHGTADKTVPIDPTARAAANAIPNAKLREYNGAAHGLFVTHKNQLMEDLISFL